MTRDGRTDDVIIGKLLATSRATFRFSNPVKRQTYEPRHEQTGFLFMRKQRHRSVVIAQLISAFVFATRIVQSLFFQNLKFQTSSHLLWLYSPVCVGPGQKPRRPVFSRRSSIMSKQTATSNPNSVAIPCTSAS